jgi:hypothetical protein
LRETTPFSAWPRRTLFAVTVNVTRDGGTICRVADASATDTVRVFVEATARVEIVNEVIVEPAGTLTVAGADAMDVSLSVTT